MRRYALNILTVFLLLILTICDTALAEERQVYAAQGDVAFFKENDKIGLQSTDGTVLHAAEFDGTGYFDATGQANIYVDDKIGRIDRTGKIIVEPFACDEIEAIPTNCASEAVPPYVLLVSWYGADGEKVMQLMNTEGEWLSDTKFDLMLYEFENGKLFIRYEDQYNQIDTNGQLTSEVWWEYIFFAPLDEIRVDESFDRGRLFFDKHVDLWQHIAAIQDVSDGTPLMLAERDFRVHAGKYDMLSVIRTGSDRVESFVVFLHKRFSPGRLFPYPLTESVFNGLLLLLGKGSGFLVQYALLLAIRILNGVKDARISQIQRIF